MNQLAWREVLSQNSGFEPASQSSERTERVNLFSSKSLRCWKHSRPGTNNKIIQRLEVFRTRHGLADRSSNPPKTIIILAK